MGQMQSLTVITFKKTHPQVIEPLTQRIQTRNDQRCHNFVQPLSIKRPAQLTQKAQAKP
ncbi:hypothetical protein ACVXG9_04790 [Escherichia coli]|jgi:hypothetical protein